MKFKLRIHSVEYKKHECFVTLKDANSQSELAVFRFRMFSTDRAFKRYKPGDDYVMTLERSKDETQA